MATDNTPISHTRTSSHFKSNDQKLFKRIKKWVGPCLSILIFCLAAWFLHEELGSISRDIILSQLHAISWFDIISALCCVIGSYFCLTLYDVLALRHLKIHVPIKKTFMTAFIAYAVGHNVGFSAISGGAVRYRIYTLHDLSTSDIAKLTFFISITFTIGISFLFGIALQLASTEQTDILKLHPFILQIISFLLICYPLIYIVGTFFIRSPLQFYRWKLQLPHAKIAIGQMVISLIELFFASAILYVLLSEHLSISYFSFLSIYLLAMIAGILSSIPGGIGVFEAVLIAALPEIDKGTLIATIILYRVFYYILPLIFAMLIFCWHEVITSRLKTNQ
ncbi:MAG: lysylphosphatidylglycerol synthase domain-containing protein [Cellvibrionaceae bacterium]